MNPNLLPIDTLLAILREASRLYLFPTLIGMALLIVLTALVIDRGRESRRRGDEEDRPLYRAPLPVAPPLAVPAPVVAAPVAVAPTPASILVVDDSAVARAKLRRLFEGAGYTVVAARDGLEALETLGSAFFSVLVTDLEMPQMSGIELIASVQGSLETEDLPIVAITGHDELQAHARDYQGLYGIFRKPWNDRDLLKRVEALATLRKPSTARVVAARPVAVHHDEEPATAPALRATTVALH